MTDLYERIGGKEIISEIATGVYKKVKKDPSLTPFFKHVDMKEQVVMFRYYLKYAFGGSEKYSGQDLRHAHAHLKIDDTHFDAMLRYFITSMKETNMSADLIKESVHRIFSLKNDVLNR